MPVFSYSQNREDVLLNRIFADRGEGYYIDVGAGDPIFDSVTKLFYERGWRGINIEPMPSVFEGLTKDRGRDINLPIGLSNREGILAFHEFPRAPGFSTFSARQADLHRRAGYASVERSIPVTTLARVCEQYDVPEIDFLKIDVESLEREVIEGADWVRFRPRVVVVEATRPATIIPSHDEWESLLLEADYLFAYFDGLNRYYVRAEDRALIPQLAVPVNIFDHYLIFQHHQQIQDIHGMLEATRRSLGESQAAHESASAALVGAQQTIAEMQRILDDSRAALEQTRAALAGTRADLDATHAQLAPFLDLGPIALAVARQIRRMATHSPKVASMAKWMIRRAYPPARTLQPHS